MWQFIVGVFVGGAFGFFVAALVMGANVYKQERKPKENGHFRTD